MSARDVMAQAICERWFCGNDRSADDETIARIASDALTASGYRILAPGELDPETVERCAKVADGAEQMRVRLFEQNEASINAHKAVQAHDIATAIRSLGRPQP